MAARALVLGGGGVVGIAWETGVLKGLSDDGVDPAAADVWVGTSAGSTVGSQVAAGLSLDALLAAQLGPSDGRTEQLAARADRQALMHIFRKLAALGEPSPEALAEIGALALAARTCGEEERLEMVQARLGVEEWPERRLVITAVDALTGERVTWDRSSGVSLARAVASSSAVPGLYPPVTVDGRRYMDGGISSTTSADLARGCGTVLIVAPIGGIPRRVGAPPSRLIDREVSYLQQNGAVVRVIEPDAVALLAFGPNLMDTSRRGPAATAGVRQGAALAAGIRADWSAAT